MTLDEDAAETKLIAGPNTGSRTTRYQFADSARGTSADQHACSRIRAGASHVVSIGRTFHERSVRQRGSARRHRRRSCAQCPRQDLHRDRQATCGPGHRSSPSARQAAHDRDPKALSTSWIPRLAIRDPAQGASMTAARTRSGVEWRQRSAPEQQLLVRCIEPMAAIRLPRLGRT